MSYGDIRHIIDRAGAGPLAVFSTYRRGEYECVFADTGYTQQRMRDDQRFITVVRPSMSLTEIRDAVERNI